MMFILGLFALTSAIAKPSLEVTESDRRFLSDVVAAVARRDAEWIAAHSALPMVIRPDSERRLVKTEEEFAKVISELLTDRVRIMLESEAKQEPIKEQGGVRIGYGILWFEERRSSEDSPSHYVITSLGFFAVQPRTQANQSPLPTSGLRPDAADL